MLAPTNQNLSLEEHKIEESFDRRFEENLKNYDSDP
jgi:hypothetical protein